MSEGELLRDLDDGLIIRRGRRSDHDELVERNRAMHSEDGVPADDAAAEVSDNLSGSHPLVGPEDYTVVEDTRTHTIVSSLCLIGQTWRYDAIPFPIGRVEFVWTDEAYRRRGLVRQQFDIVHGWSAERGHMAQFVTGIPWYYRQFGYELALAYRTSRLGPITTVPALKPEQTEPFQIRPAAEADLLFIAQTYDEAMRHYLVSTDNSEALWRFDLLGRHEKVRLAYRIIETPEGQPVGFIEHFRELFGGRLIVSLCYLLPGVSWFMATPTIFRYLVATGTEYAARDGQSFRLIAFRDRDHPVTQVFPSWLPINNRPWLAYMRVPDIRGFLMHITPVIEERLARSLAAGHSGELCLHWYRDGMRLVIEHGRLTTIEPWQPPKTESGDAAFPDLTFLQRLFGHRSQEELEYAFNDCWSRNEATRALLDILFPKQASFARGIY